MSHFDDRAATWDDDPTHTQRAAAIVAALRAHVSLTPQTTVLEVGAGTGAIGRSLAPVVQSVTLLDASAGMTNVARQRIEEAGLTNVTAVHGELDAPLGQRFDLIVGSLMLHHVDGSPISSPKAARWPSPTSMRTSPASSTTRVSPGTTASPGRAWAPT